MLNILKKYVGRLVRKGINLSIRKDSKLLTFIPHGGCEKDGYNFMNYKSDSALTFFNYIANKYGDKYTYQIAAGENERKYLQKMAEDLYPELNVTIISHPLICRNHFAPCKALSKSNHIFTSQALPLDYILPKQEVCYLGYYAGNFKNDLIEKYQKSQHWYNKTYKFFFSPSQLFSQLNSIVYESSLSKFHITGLVRNDNLLQPYDCLPLDSWISNNVDYNVEKVFLYTPTHRDYEETVVKQRGILGFEINKKQLECFLKEYKAVIIVKIHSHQNTEALKTELPKGVLLHKASKKYGLNELLQRADYLITDYTSTYFDYLLLDRPVLFNFYDFNVYQETRGFSFDPIDSILAGEIFSDQNSMIEKMNLIMQEDRYKEKRGFVRDLLFKYKDGKAAERVYNYVFNAQKTSN